VKIWLGEADRERYGLGTDPLDFDPTTLMQDEAEDLDDYGIQPDGWDEFILGAPILGPDRKPLPRADKPHLPQRHPPTARAWRALVWLALRRNGHKVALADVNFDRGPSATPSRSTTAREKTRRRGRPRPPTGVHRPVSSGTSLD
jgi:hypothetical protein